MIVLSGRCDPLRTICSFLLSKFNKYETIKYFDFSTVKKSHLYTIIVNFIYNNQHIDILYMACH